MERLVKQPGQTAKDFYLQKRKENYKKKNNNYLWEGFRTHTITSSQNINFNVNYKAINCTPMSYNSYTNIGYENNIS